MTEAGLVGAAVLGELAICAGGRSLQAGRASWRGAGRSREASARLTASALASGWAEASVPHDIDARGNGPPAMDDRRRRAGLEVPPPRAVDAGQRLERAVVRATVGDGRLVALTGAPALEAQDDDVAAHQSVQGRAEQCAREGVDLGEDGGHEPPCCPPCDGRPERARLDARSHSPDRSSAAPRARHADESTGGGEGVSITARDASLSSGVSDSRLGAYTPRRWRMYSQTRTS